MADLARTGARRDRALARGLERGRRRRAADPPRARAAQRPPARVPPGDPRREGLPTDALRRFEALLRRELERAQIERTGELPPSRPLGELDRALPSGPAADLAAVHRVVAQLRRRLATQGVQRRGSHRHDHVDIRRTMRASLQTGGVPVVAAYRPRRPRRPEIYVLCDVSTSVTRPRSSSSRCCTRCTTRSGGCARSSSSSGSPRSPTPSRASAASPRSANAISERRRRRRHLRLHRLRARLVGVPRARRGRAAPARDRDRARRRAHQRARPARRPVRARSPRAPGGRSG
jgi:hypothetical protein